MSPAPLGKLVVCSVSLFLMFAEESNAFCNFLSETHLNPDESVQHRHVCVLPNRKCSVNIQPFTSRAQCCIPAT